MNPPTLAAALVLLTGSAGADGTTPLGVACKKDTAGIWHCPGPFGVWMCEGAVSRANDGRGHQYCLTPSGWHLDTSNSLDAVTDEVLDPALEICERHHGPYIISGFQQRATFEPPFQDACTALQHRRDAEDLEFVKRAAGAGQ